MKRLIVTALLLCSSTASQAAEWWWLGNYGSPMRYNRYLDRSSIQKDSGGVLEAWTLDITERPNPDTGVSWSKGRQRFDCRNHTVTPLGVSAYTAEGVLVAAVTFDNPQTAAAVAGTAGGAAFGLVCQQGKVSGDVVADPIAHSIAYFKLPQPGGTQTAVAANQPNQQAPQAGAQAAAPAPGSEANGTGFFVNAKGDLVTAFHVVDGAAKIVVISADGRMHPAEILRSSPATDLAVLAVDYRPARYLSLAAPGRAKPGDHVFTFGYPAIDVQGAEAKYTDGAISSLSGLRDEASLAQISIPVQPGNSGGPVVNDRGEVVGVVDAVASPKEYMAATGTLPQNVNWAVRGEYVIPLVRAAEPLPVRSRDEAVALTRDAVALVWVKY